MFKFNEIMKKYILLFIFICIPLSLFAQSDSVLWISGHIKINVFGEIKNGHKGFIVKIQNTIKGAITDDSGCFKIKSLATGKYRLITGYISYDNIDTTINVINKPVENLILTVIVKCKNYNLETAEKDIENNTPKLLLFGGFFPVYVPGQENFEKKYNVKYYDFVDAVEDSDECLEIYNKRIFKYLDEKYGDEWRKEVRKDVLFLNH